jgi:ribosomal protein S18 acetylase RimI-like enzyme
MYTIAPIQLTSASGHALTFRSLAASDAAILGRFFLALSDETKRRFGPHPFDQATADALCSNVHLDDTVRLIATQTAPPHNHDATTATTTSDNERIIAYFILMLGVTEHETERYSKVGIRLSQDFDCTFAPVIADAYQNQGIASALMDRTMEIMSEYGRKRIVLLGGTQATNHRAVRFYEKHHFRHVGAFEHPHGVYNYDMMAVLGTPHQDI